jgi:two-component system LytT family sensor kinase
MGWHNFIFSDKKSDRIKRHLLFWMLWWIYFAATYYYYVQVGLKEIDFGNLSGILLLKTFLLLLIHVAACYTFIDFLLPRYLLKKRYLLLSTSLLLTLTALLISGYLVHAKVFPIVDAAYNYNLPPENDMIWWTSINSVLLNAPKIIAAATAIKLVKRWYLKQKEKEKIEKEKLITDLQLLKAQIRPDFLFSSLEQIYSYTIKRSPEAPELLIKFSDLLSYMLYECDDLKVPLEKELMMTKEFIALEKLRFGRSLEIEVTVKGNAVGKEIAPLLLLPFIENSFRQCTNMTEQPWINIDINIYEEVLTMKLTNGVDPEMTDVGEAIKAEEIRNVKKRLGLLYENNHELKMHADNEIYVTILKLNLKKASLATSIPQLTFNSNESLIKYAVN